jgi:hypothetical protein
MEFSDKPFRTLISSISLELTSLNTYRDTIHQKETMQEKNNKLFDLQL